MKIAKKNNQLSLLTFGSIISIVGIVVIFLFNSGRWLLISDPLPEKLDVIFTFAGENLRVSYSREINLKYPESYWLLSDYKNGYARLLRKSNFNMTKVYTVDTCQSTYSEANALNTWLKNHNDLFKDRKKLSIGLISSPYHMRRIQLMIKRKFKNSDITFHYLPVPLDRYNWSEDMFKKWWKSSAVSKQVISEIQKIIYFLLIS